MGITVKEAMEIYELSNSKVVAGEKGLDKVIEHITVMEVPDIIQWLKGNELILTSLYPIKDDEQALAKIVQQLVDTKSSALAIKVDRFVKKIPSIIISEANRLNFPIIELASHVTYLDIMNPLMRLILNESQTEHEKIDAFLKWITEMAMSGKGIHPIIQALDGMMGNPITIETDLTLMEGIPQYAEIQDLTLSQKRALIKLKQPTLMKRVKQNQETNAIVTPLIIHEELYGYLTCWQIHREFKHLDYVLLEKIVPLLALEFLKVITRIDVEQHYKNNFLSELLDGVNDKKYILKKAEIYNWDLSKDYVPIVMDIKQQDVKQQEITKRVFRILEKVFWIYHIKAIIGIKKERFVTLFPINTKSKENVNEMNNTIQNMINKIQKQLKSDISDATFIFGIGRFYEGFSGLVKSYQEGVKAIHLSKNLPDQNGCVFFENLGIYRILSDFHDESELRAIFEETVGKIIEYDQKNDTSLMETLIGYFANNKGLSQLADKLYIHINTLKYRLQKIEQITNLSLNNNEDKLMLHMGLKIYFILSEN